MIGAVINFCTHDYRTLGACIAGVKPFATQIIIPVCDHFFDGTPEERWLLDIVYAEHPDCTFIEFHYDPTHLYGTHLHIESDHPHYVHHWHNTSRLVAYYFLEPQVETVLFLDADEVMDSVRFEAWTQSFDYRRYSALRLNAYYYFREARYQALTVSQHPLLVRRADLKPEHLLDPDERMGTLSLIPGWRSGNVNGLDGDPLVHHYSWVKTKEEMLHKTRRWGHHWERNWEELIEEEFSRSFNGTDFIEGRSYKEVVPYFDPLAVTLPSVTATPPLSFSHVHKITAQDIFRKDLILQCL